MTSIEKYGGIELPMTRIKIPICEITLFDMADPDVSPRSRLEQLSEAGNSVGINGIVVVQNIGPAAHNFLNSRGIFGGDVVIKLQQDLCMPIFSLLSSGYVDEINYQDVLAVTRLVINYQS